MSAQNSIKVPRVFDSSIFSAFGDIAKKYGVSKVHVTAVGNIDIGKVDLFDDDQPEIFKNFLKGNSCLISNIVLSIDQLNIRYYRSGQDKASFVWDEIVFQNEQSNPSATLDIVAFFTKKYVPIDIASQFAGSNTKEVAELFSIHNSILTRLEDTNEKLLCETQQYREELDRQFVLNKGALEQSINEERIEIQKGLNKKDDELRVREESIQERLKLIDDRGNTHARRDTRERMLNDVKARVEKFDLSNETRSKRFPVMAGILAMCLAFILVAGLSWREINAESGLLLDKEAGDQLQALLQEKNSGASPSKPGEHAVPAVLTTIQLDRTHLYMLWVRFALAFSGLITTILFYIKWANGWANKHVETEFNLQQFYIDVNRANWVIESCLEWRKETNSAIPADLLKSMTRNLFSVHQSEPETIIHPADALASALLGSASNLKLNIAGNEVEFAKPGKIKNKPMAVSAEGE